MTSNAIPGSVAHEAIQFLRTRTGEVTTGELARGIGRPVKRLSQHLAPAVTDGLLARRVDGGFAFWKLGHQLDRTQSPPVAADEQQIVKVSALAAPSVFAYADQRRAAPFSVALHTDGRLLIERHGRLLLELTHDERITLVTAAAQGVTPQP
jgi:hypothetical protein